MTMLATHEVDGQRLGEDDVGTFFELLLTAGIETTGAAIAHGLIALLRNPDQMAAWRSGFAAGAPAAVEEILRWSTPVVHFRRTAVADTRIAETEIAAGDKVVVFFNSANRDESVFDDPHRLDLRRSPNPHLTFGGGGPHFCLGAHLARLEMRILFEELLQTLPDIRLSAEPGLHALHVLQRCEGASVRVPLRGGVVPCPPSTPSERSAPAAHRQHHVAGLLARLDIPGRLDHTPCLRFVASAGVAL